MYLRPDTLDDVLGLLSQGGKQILAGCTDFYPALGERAPFEPVVDISAVDELRGIRQEADCWQIGALTTWTDIVRADLPPAFDALKLAAREIGSIQIQNRATIAGNLCNASPAADGVPPLLILDAEIQVCSVSGRRRLALSDFIDGYRSTVLAPGELVTSIIVPKSKVAGGSAFLKLGTRNYLVISIAMVAARLSAGPDGKIDDAAIAVGACSAVAKRLASLEAKLLGRDMSAGFAGVVEAHHLSDLSPIDDVRATAAYRLSAAVQLIERSLAQAANGTVVA